MKVLLNIKPALTFTLKLVTFCQFVSFNCRHVYVCVSSVRCSSQEWETSEYSDSYSVWNFSNQKGGCCMSPSIQGNVVMMLCFPVVSDFFSPVAKWGLSSLSSPRGQKWCHQLTRRDFFDPPHAHMLSACVFFLYKHTCLKLCPFSALPMRNMTLNLLFIAFVCLKKHNRPLAHLWLCPWK